MKNYNVIKRKINKFMWTSYAAICAVMMSTLVAFADGGSGGGSIFQEILNTICPYITALGGVVAMIGGVNWALGFKSEDSDAQVRGIRTLIAGVAVAAVVVVAQQAIKIPA